MEEDPHFFPLYNKRISKIQRLSDSDVLTPELVVEDQIANLKKYQDFRGKTFLDPSCGRGGYLVKIYDELFELYKEIKDIEERNILVINSIIGIDIEKYYVDISKQSLKDTQKYHGVKNVQEPRIFQQDYINERSTEMKFDAIVGNFPFDGPYEGSNSIWKKFIKKSKETLNPGGYLCCITPNGWLYDNKAKPVISSMNLVYADLDRREDFIKEGQKIGSTITFLIAENSTYEGKTDFRFKDSEYSVNFLEFEKFPSKYLDETAVRIFQKFISGRKKIECISMSTKRDVSLNQTETHRFPAWNTDAQPLVFIPQERYKEDKKIVFAGVSRFSPFYDDGTISVARQAKIILVKNKKIADSMLSFFNTKPFRFNEENTREGGWVQISNIIPELDWGQLWTDEKVYKEFGYSEDEIKYIEERIK